MTNIKLIVNGAKAKATVDGILTSGAIGIPVTIQYDSAWDGLTKNLVCTSGKWGPTSKPRTILNVDTSATVAHEVMIADNYLYLGVEGRDTAGTPVIRTALVECGKIFPGADANAKPSAKPTLPIWAQLQQQINALKETAAGTENEGCIQNEYTLPMATAETLGGVMPVTKTEDMTQPVGVDRNGQLYTVPGGCDGTDDYAALSNKPTINGVTLEGNKTAGDLGIGNPTDEQVAAAVSTWLDEHPEAATTVADGSITTEKLADDSVILSKLSESVTDEHYFDPYLRVQYTVGMINADGTINTGGTARVTEYLPVVPGETIWLNGGLTNAVAYYDKGKTFLLKQSTSSGLNPYNVPNGAHYAIYQNTYSGGYVPFFPVRKKATPRNECFSDLVFSPIKSVVSIGVTGDSNTKGYGLSDGELSWAELMMAELEKTDSIRILHHSRFVEVLGAHVYDSGLNFKTGSQISVWTDSQTIELGCGANYSSVFSWYKNDVEIEGSSGLTSVELDGELSKITVKFTGGQMVGAYFTIPKTITHTNAAVVGIGAGNVTIPGGHDWLLIMVGTNDRSTLTKNFFGNSIYQYSGKGTYIVPFPNHKEESTNIITQAYRFNEYRNLLLDCGYEVIDCSDSNGWAFYDDTLFQADLIHFSGKGHRIMCNMISGKLGVPVMLKAG